MEDKLTFYRNSIDAVDREMAELFEKRMRTVHEIAVLKKELGLPVLDETREAAVIQKNAEFIQDKQLQPYYIGFIKDVMRCSKKYQLNLMEGMKVAFCGVEGAYASIAAEKIFPAAQKLSFNDFHSAYASVEEGESDCCVLPIENSTVGEIGAVIDMMFSGSLYVTGVYALPIVHHLLGTKTAEKDGIRKVISHPQALMQCRDYIEENGFVCEQASNTAVAAKTVVELNDASTAAIASKETAKLYGLKILDHDINMSTANTTRFAVFSRAADATVEKENHFILLFTLNNTVGALAKAINIISSHGFDMRVLRSRPVQNVPWQYYFYVEAVGDQSSEEGVRMLNELNVCCVKLKVVGHFAKEINLGQKE